MLCVGIPNHLVTGNLCFLVSPFSPPDSTGPMSTAHTHPSHMGGMVGHSSVISTSRPLPSPMSSLVSPMNGLASPYPVITSSLGSPSISLPSTPNMNFGPLSSPQVRKCVWAFWWSLDNCGHGLKGFLSQTEFSFNLKKVCFYIWNYQKVCVMLHVVLSSWNSALSVYPLSFTVPQKL